METLIILLVLFVVFAVFAIGGFVISQEITIGKKLTPAEEVSLEIAQPLDERSYAERHERWSAALEIQSSWTEDGTLRDRADPYG